MYKSKLLRLFQSLDDTEIRQLKKWIHSPIHNKHKDVSLLFDFLLSRQQLNAQTTDRNKAYAYLYPKQKLNMPRLRHVMSFATEVLEAFIQYKEATDDTDNIDLLLLKSYRKRDLKKDAEKQQKHVRKKLEEHQIQNEDFYWLNYRLEIEQFRMLSKGDRPANTNLQEVMNSASVVFVLSILRYACICISHQNLYKKNYEVPFINQIVEAIANNAYASIVSIQIYYACYISLTQPQQEDSYKTLKQYLDDYPYILPASEYKQVYEMALNFCIRRLNKGEKNYAEEAFQLYMKGIDNKILLENNHLSHFAFKNIVAIGLYLDKKEIIHSFIETGGLLLHPDYRENYIHYNTAKYYFSTKDYDAARDLLISMEYDDIFMTVDAKMMMLKMYVMQEEFDLMESFVKSFAQFLRRKSELSYHRKGFLNTLRLTKKLIYAYTEQEKSKLKQEIDETSPLPEKQWLLQRLNA